MVQTRWLVFGKYVEWNKAGKPYCSEHPARSLLHSFSGFTDDGKLPACAVTAMKKFLADVDEVALQKADSSDEAVSSSEESEEEDASGSDDGERDGGDSSGEEAAAAKPRSRAERASARSKPAPAAAAAAAGAGSGSGSGGKEAAEPAAERKPKRRSP
jgi:hypothetical protein